MNKTSFLIPLLAIATVNTAVAEKVEAEDSLAIQEVVVTGTRNAVDVRHLPMTVTVIDRQRLTEQQQTSILPTAMQQVPSQS
jgi:iron complex outermembrane receptor protein